MKLKAKWRWGRCYTEINAHKTILNSIFTLIFVWELSVLLMVTEYYHHYTAILPHLIHPDSVLPGFGPATTVDGPFWPCLFCVHWAPSIINTVPGGSQAALRGNVRQRAGREREARGWIAKLLLANVAAVQVRHKGEIIANLRVSSSSRFCSLLG